MSRATIELDFLELEKKQTSNAPKPKFQKFLDRRRGFREIQSAISKIDPEIIKLLLTSTQSFSRLIQLRLSCGICRVQFYQHI